MKKMFAIGLVLALALLLAACGGTPAPPAPPSSSAPPAEASPAPAPAPAPKPPETTTSQYIVELNGVTVVSDYEGNPAVLIDYVFTNNSEETTSAGAALNIQVFQNGVELESAFVTLEDYEDDSYKDIRPGASINVSSAYSLGDTSASIEVEVRDWQLLPDNSIIAYKEFSLGGTDNVPSGAEASEEGDGAAATVSWEEFLAEYEAWVDDYIALLEKYKANPADMTILTDYTRMMQELTEWTEKGEALEADLADFPEALAEYSAALARILQKLNEAMV